MKWQTQKLEDIASFFEDGNWIESKDQSPKGYWLVQTGNIGVISFRDKEHKRFVNEETFQRLNCTEILPGDILISRLPEPIGRSCIVPKSVYRMLTAVDCTIVRLEQDYDARYINYLLNSETAKKQVYQMVTGSSRKRISRKNLGKVELPIPFVNGKPDIKEQRRVADELDGLLKLKEVASVDTQKVDAIIGSVSRTQFRSTGEAGAVKLGEICNITKGTSPTLKTKPGKYPLVVTSAERKSADNYQFDDEAVCIPLVSSTGHGHASLHRIHYQKGQFALANIIVALTAKDKDEVNMKYLYYYLSYYRNELLVPLMRGVANVTIPFASLSQVLVSLPDIQEQRKVVSIFDEVEKLKQKLSERNVLVNQLVPSMMNRSFATQT